MPAQRWTELTRGEEPDDGYTSANPARDALAAPFPVNLGGLPLLIDPAAPTALLDAWYREDVDDDLLALRPAELAMFEATPPGRYSDARVLRLRTPDPQLLAPLTVSYADYERSGPDAPSWAAGELLLVLRRLGLDLTETDTEQQLLADARVAYGLLPDRILDAVRSTSAGALLEAVLSAIASVPAAPPASFYEELLRQTSAARTELAFAAGIGHRPTVSHRVDLKVRTGGVVDAHWTVESGSVHLTVTPDPVRGCAPNLRAELIVPDSGSPIAVASGELAIDNGMLVAELDGPGQPPASAWVYLTDQTDSSAARRWYSAPLAAGHRLAEAHDLRRRAAAFTLFRTNARALPIAHALTELADRAAVAATELASDESAPTLQKHWTALRRSSSTAATHVAPGIHEVIEAAWELDAGPVEPPEPSISRLLMLAPLIRAAGPTAEAYANAALLDPDSHVLAGLTDRARATENRSSSDG